MAHAIAFDTLAYAKKLIAVGVPVQQAEMQAETFAEIIDENLATKHDIEKTKSDLVLEIEKVKAELLVIKWMLGVVLAGIISLVLKTFFT